MKRVWIVNLRHIVFAQGEAARLSRTFSDHRIPYDPFDGLRPYRALLEGYQSARARLEADD